jgi:hypothetical protein
MQIQAPHPLHFIAVPAIRLGMYFALSPNRLENMRPPPMDRILSSGIAELHDEHLVAILSPFLAEFETG